MLDGFKELLETAVIADVTKEKIQAWAYRVQHKFEQ